MSTSARLAWVPVVLLLALGVVGCSSSGTSPDGSLPVRPSPSLDLPPTLPPSGAPVTGEVPEPVLEAVRRQLATDVPGADLATATVVTAEAVEWSDSSLGCPEPGMVYMQVITPGYHVVVSVGGVEYDYRATESGQIRLCGGPA